MRNAKLVLIATFAVLQVVLAAHLAVAAPVAHGRFNGVTLNGATDPEYAGGGQRLTFSATAVNDGDSTGWFTICVMRVAPPLTSIFPPTNGNQEYKEYAINCDDTVPLDPGGKVTFVSNRWLMLSAPVGTNVTFWIMLFVQQQEPIPISDDSDYLNLSIDELRVVELTSF